MYFKQLEIVGFKSFLGKTKLKFETGVTAVVGPNGCGKSNVVDAIKWVLGEQSVKSMRSASMQDVIFNGTEKQDPVNVAEVSLTLSNEDRMLPVDFDEVTISRRLYRSGESEYLLNKTPVRLADVRNLLMGTGIGTSSYSIVEQGRMDMILSSKPEERRHIFEEASGITRYKAKKREALLKLDRTKENLTRINDIIREVERQIRSIERKARKAERYKIRYDELKDLDVKLSWKKYRALSTDDFSLGEETGELKRGVDVAASKLEAFAEALSRLREEYNDLMEDLQVSQGEMTQLAADIDKGKHVIGMNAERVEELRRYAERLEGEISEAEERSGTMKSRLESLETEVSGMRGKRQDKDTALASAEENIRVVNEKLERHRHELRFKRESTVDIVSEQTKAKNQVIKANADMQNMLSREKRLKLERVNVQAEKENIEEALRHAEERVTAVQGELEAKKSDFRAFNEEYVGRQQKLETLNNEKREKEKRVNEIRPRRQFFEKLIAEREGINESVKEIMRRVESGDPRFEGIHGILSELINVRDEYEESLEVILGDAAQAVIVDDRHVEDRIAAYLAENSMESVNFMILDELKGLFEEGKASNITKGTLDDITQVLSAQEPYCLALRVLLKDTYVTISPEAARLFVDRSNDFDGRIIGEKGEIYQKGMRRSHNHSTKELIPLFGRKEKVSQMREEEEQLTSQIEEMNTSITSLEDWLKEAAVKRDRLESDLSEKQMEYAGAFSRKTAVKEKFDALTQELLVLGTEIDEERNAIEALKTEKDTLERTLEELEARHTEIQSQIEAEQQAIQEFGRYREETLFCLADVKAELSVLRKEEENLSYNLERERESSQRLENEVNERRDRITESGERIRSLEEETVSLEEKNLEDAAVLDVKKREIEEKRTRKEELDHTIARDAEALRTKERELEELRNRTRDLDIRTKEVEYKRAALMEKVLDTYKVNISEIELELDENADWEAMDARVGELKQQLEGMGEVSLGAVEEHKQLEERFQFLTKQRADLVAGRDALLQAITKINRTTRKLFMETFESIRREFNDYFRMLFSGGKAELVLQDESDVLECGIDIVVRPPGKKLHNILQLSGGEKAMTAIALIFAIFKVNPSPFCVLDEIDAPLDESNIMRFCRVLQEFLKLSQFVIITHNRMTIQLADVLYGITMEEKGVSKMVSVKFAEEKESTAEEAVPAAV